MPEVMPELAQLMETVGVKEDNTLLPSQLDDINEEEDTDSDESDDTLRRTSSDSSGSASGQASDGQTSDDNSWI